MGRLPGQTKLAIEARMWPTATSNMHTGAGASGRNGGLNLQSAVVSWPTPQAHDATGGSAERVGQYGTKHGGRNLADDVMLWQTPNSGGFESRRQVGKADREMLLGGQAKAWSWPTPAARDWKGQDKPRHQGGASLPHFVETGVRVHGHRGLRMPMPGEPSSPSAPTSRRRLNPLFVEWLMGWSEGWSSLAPIVSASSATASSPSRPRSPSGFSPARWESHCD